MFAENEIFFFKQPSVLKKSTLEDLLPSLEYRQGSVDFAPPIALTFTVLSRAVLVDVALVGQQVHPSEVARRRRCTRVFNTDRSMICREHMYRSV
jgi:hypothetical protein